MGQSCYKQLTEKHGGLEDMIQETDNSDRVIAPADPAAKSSPASEKEQAARAAIQACAGRVLDDSEWQRVRSRLLAYASLLGAWQRNAAAHAADLPEAA